MRHNFRVLAIFMILCAPAVGQEGPTRYPAAYFAPNQPSTAFDMIELLPGFRIELGDSDIRGFSGSVGNVLIDGQLPTSKEENAEQLLRRISASTVERVELIRAAADMHGYSVLANVVRKRSGASLQGRTEVEFATNHFGQTGPKVALNLTRQGEFSNWDMSFAWGREIQNIQGFGTRDRFAADGITPLRLAEYSFPELKNFAEISTSYRQKLWTGDLSVGFVLKQQRQYSLVNERVYFPAMSQSSGLESLRSRNGEARLDYQGALGSWGQLQIFAVHRQAEQDEISQTSDLTGIDLARSRYNLREDVARFAWQYEAGSLKLESGTEGAINVLQSRSILTSNGVAVVLPAANLRVQEQRAEFFAKGTWQFSSNLVTELGTRFETSTLSQSGDSRLTKDLSFLKPRWLTTWNPSPGHILRFLIERKVGQLDFRNFASSTSLNSNTVNGGNANLEPEHSWEISLAWERHFWGRASFVLEASREFISNVVDHVPVFANGRVFDAVGNIGSARRLTLDAKLILPLDELGLTGVTLKANVQASDSNTFDPPTGFSREISGTRPFLGDLELTYDLPALNLKLGGALHTRAHTLDVQYRVDSIDQKSRGVKLDAFVEYKPSSEWTLRLFGTDLTQTGYYRDRDIYPGLRGVVALSSIERRKLNSGALVGFNIQRNL